MKSILKLTVALALAIGMTAAFAQSSGKPVKTKPAVTKSAPAKSTTSKRHKANWFARMFTAPHHHHTAKSTKKAG
ncbi:MAG: hypothetical protein IT203_05195 [Fimbriimonadaceae bacterium]|nr:hypothetical protein [Fimbriimonadaceae bacterium]